MAVSSPVGDRPSGDPIDALVPPPRPWWVRLVLAVAIVVAVGLAGWWWRFGVLRPAPDCCGSGSSGPQIGLSDHAGAVTITAYLFNSSPRAITMTGADADLPGARLVEVAPYRAASGLTMPPQGLGAFPQTIAPSSGAWLAVSFQPEDCSTASSDHGNTGEDWGTVTVDLAVAGDPWYPTIDRRYQLPDALAPAGPGQLGVLPPASSDRAFTGDEHPIRVACALLGR